MSKDFKDIQYFLVTITHKQVFPTWLYYGHEPNYKMTVSEINKGDHKT